MKQLFTYLITALSLASCADPATTFEPVDESPVRIAVAVGSHTTNHAGSAGSVGENNISELRLMAFRTSDATLAFNQRVDYNNAAPYHIFELPVGRYTLVAVAGEHRDATLSAKLDGLTPSSTLTQVAALSFAASAFDAGSDIPMMTSTPVTISRVNDTEGTTDLGSPLALTLTRMGVRIDIEVTLDAAQMEQWMASGGDLYLDRVPDCVYIFPRDNSAATSTATIACASRPQIDETLGQRSISIRGVILPESRFAPADDASRGMQLRLWDGTRQISGVIALSPDNLTVPRGSYLDVQATVGDGTFEFKTSVAPWDDENVAVNEL